MPLIRFRAESVIGGVANCRYEIDKNRRVNEQEVLLEENSEGYLRSLSPAEAVS